MDATIEDTLSLALELIKIAQDRQEIKEELDIEDDILNSAQDRIDFLLNELNDIEAEPDKKRLRPQVEIDVDLTEESYEFVEEMRETADLSPEHIIQYALFRMAVEGDDSISIESNEELSEVAGGTD